MVLPDHVRLRRKRGGTLLVWNGVSLRRLVSLRRRMPLQDQVTNAGQIDPNRQPA
jgi:hypothetical protein